MIYELFCVYVLSHALFPLIVSTYISKKNSEIFDWSMCYLVVGMAIILLYCSIKTNILYELILENSAIMYRLKAFLLISYIFGGTLQYYFMNKKIQTTNTQIINYINNGRALFIYGIIGNIIVFGWWGRGLMEVALWTVMATIIVWCPFIIKREYNHIKIMRTGVERKKVAKTHGKLKMIGYCARLTAVLMAGAVIVCISILRIYFIILY